MFRHSLNPFFVFAVVAFILPSVHADQRDIWSIGASSSPGNNILRLDGEGHLVPGISNRYDLGKSTASWRSLYASSATINQANVATTTLVNFGAQAVAHGSAGSTLTANSSFILISATGNYTFTSIPTITTAGVNVGMIAVLKSTRAMSALVTIQNDPDDGSGGGLSGTGIKFSSVPAEGGAGQLNSYVISSNTVIGFIFDGKFWQEMFRSKND